MALSRRESQAMHLPARLSEPRTPRGFANDATPCSGCSLVANQPTRSLIHGRIRCPWKMVERIRVDTLGVPLVSLSRHDGYRLERFQEMVFSCDAKTGSDSDAYKGVLGSRG